MPRKPESTAPEISESTRAARDLSLLLETRKEVAREVTEELVYARAYVEFFDRYEGMADANGRTTLEMLRDYGLPHLGGLLQEALMEVFKVKSSDEIVAQPELLTPETVAMAWERFIGKLKKMLGEAVFISHYSPLLPWLTNRSPKEVYVGIKHEVPFDLEALLPGWVSGKDLPERLEAAEKNPPSAEKILEATREWARISKIVAERLAEEEEKEKPVELETPDFLFDAANRVSERTFREMFGGDWRRVLFDMMPSGARRLLRSIQVCGGMGYDTKNVFGEQFYKGVAGDYSANVRIIRLSAESSINPSQVIKTLWHEAGHAVDLDESPKTARRNKLKFLEAVAKAGNRVSMYATETYAQQGLIRGLQEDFAESFAGFLTDPGYLKKMNPERYAFMAELFATQYPDFDPAQVRGEALKHERARTVRVIGSVEAFNKELSAFPKQELSVIFGQYPSLNHRILDHVQKRGEPGSVERRVVPTGRKNGKGVVFLTAFGPNGRPREEHPGEAGAKQSFVNAEYDEQDRLVSFEDRHLQKEPIQILLDYTGDETWPSQAFVISNGLVTEQYRFERRGDVIEEVMMSPMYKVERRIEYNLDPESGRIQELRGVIKGETAFSSSYEYDERGRLAAKILKKGDETIVNASRYQYLESRPDEVEAAKAA